MLPRHVRLLDRLLRHHLPLLCLTGGSIAVLDITRPYRDPISRASFATAYPALVLLLMTLLLGPWNVLRRKRSPVSSDLRRDVGIWAGVVGIAHSVIGQMVHLRGRPWLYYVYEHKARHVVPFRHDLFGFANFTGLGGALVLIALLATSNDYSLRALGTPRWKQLQRWNYAAFALAAAHTLAYQTSEKQPMPLIASFVGCTGLTILVQAEGFRCRRLERAAHPELTPSQTRGEREHRH